MPAVFIAPVVCVPLVVLLLPLHEPPAVHDDGLLVADHDIVALLPVLILVGDTEMFTTGIATTDTVVEADPDPAALEQLRV